MYKGSCLCGQVSYEFQEPPDNYGFCHCKTCQKASGTAFTANIAVDRSTLRLRGAANLTEYASSDGKFRCFCSTCGSPLYAYLKKSPNILRIRLGSLDTELTTPPRCHFFTADKAAWFRHSDSAPEFPGWPDKAVLQLKGSKHSQN